MIPMTPSFMPMARSLVDRSPVCEVQGYAYASMESRIVAGWDAGQGPTRRAASFAIRAEVLRHRFDHCVLVTRLRDRHLRSGDRMAAEEAPPHVRCGRSNPGQCLFTGIVLPPAGQTHRPKPSLLPSRFPVGRHSPDGCHRASHATTRWVITPAGFGRTTTML